MKGSREDLRNLKNNINKILKCDKGFNSTFSKIHYKIENSTNEIRRYTHARSKKKIFPAGNLFAQ